MKKISLTQGKVALVDDKDFEFLSKFKWYARKNGRTYYATRNSRQVNKVRTAQIQMHKVIMGETPCGKEIDHIDGNGLNNKRVNLRFATKTENNRNCLIRKDNTSGHKGVYWDKNSRKWKAQVGYNKKVLSLGRFDSIEEAIKTYQNFVKENFGEFVRN